MLQKIIVCLCFSILTVTAASVTKTYRLDQPITVSNGDVYIPGGRPSMQGFAPAVAVKGMVLACPVGQKATSATVTYGNLIKLPGKFHIRATIPAFKSTDGTRSPQKGSIYEDASAQKLLARYYEKDALYPGINHEYQPDNQFKYGVACGVVVVHPVQYNPVREELYYYDEVTVTLETEPIKAEDKVAAYVMTPFHRSILQFTIDNPEMLADFELTPMDENDYEVCVITYPAVKDKFNDYVALNKRRGLRTKVVLIADVLKTAGATNQDRIRNYINNQYKESKIVFCVLGGDIDKIVHRELYSESYDHNQTPDRFLRKYSGSDLYYGTLDGNWNSNNNNKWGEPGEEDLLWEVYVGRMPVDNTTHLTNILKKTTHYTETPHADQATNVLLAGEFMWDDYGKTIWGIDNLELCVGYKDRYGYKSYGWPEPKFKISRISDKETGAAHGWGGNDLRGKILQTKPSWIDHDGHSNTTYCMTINANAIDRTYTNEGSSQNYWIGVSQVGCNPAQFKVRDCFMEQAVYAAKGAVAMQGNWDSGYADDDDNNSQSTLVCRFARDAMFNKKKRVPFLEAAHATGKEALIDVSTDPNAINIPPYYGLIRYCTYNTNTLGDPALGVWTDKPKKLDKLFDHTVTAGKLTIKTPPYTCVLLVDPSNDKEITAQITGYKYSSGANFVVGDSTCEISDKAYKTFVANNGKIKAYIKAPNYLPAAFELSVATSISTTLPNPIRSFSITPHQNKISATYTLEQTRHASLSLYNCMGKLVKTVFAKQRLSKGTHRHSIDMSNQAAGVYYCKFTMKNTQTVTSFALTK